jgi:signal transduction histidine kinase
LVGLLLAALSYLSYQRMAWESFLHQRFVSERFVTAIEGALLKFIEEEELRPFDHYSFFTATTSEITNNQAFQRSPLAGLNADDSARGIVGYFQIDPDGRFSSPLLPESGGTAPPPVSFAASEQAERKAAVDKLRAILMSVQPAGAVPRSLGSGGILAERGVANYSDGGLPSSASDSKGSAVLSQDLLLEPRASTPERERKIIAGYDQRQLKSVEQGLGGVSSDLDGASSEKMRISGGKLGAARKELSNSLVLKPAMPSAKSAASADSLNVISFEAEIDPLQARMIDDQHLLLFRKAWRNERRYIQGVVVRQRDFVERVVQEKIAESQMLRGSSITFAPEGGDAIAFEYKPSRVSSYERASSSVALTLSNSYYKDGQVPTSAGSVLLYQATLRAPLDLYSVFIGIDRIPLPPGGGVLALVAVILSCVIAAGFFALYRLGYQHITLAQKRLDFVSSVSHELKTPLTSIRMYSELLKNDWVQGDDKRQGYYEYIFQESERLSRLISNVLQLSRISSKTEAAVLESRSVTDSLRMLHSKVETLISSAKFTLTLVEPPGASSIMIRVDEDALAQIAINLVENAVKFSRLVERREVQLGFEHTPGSRHVTFFVRDFGPGVPRSERRRIFELFYRSEDELTRQTNGTGIGLALVKELARRMGATVDYRPKEPGSEFRVVFEIQ